MLANTASTTSILDNSASSATYSQLLSLWEKWVNEDEPAYVPLVPVMPHVECLLFVGLNPSFNADAVKRLMPRLTDPENHFAWRNRNDFNPDDDRELHRLAKAEAEAEEATDAIVEEPKKGHPYFKPFARIGKALRIEWDHVDLFFWRETSQRQCRPRILQPGKAKEKQREIELTDFGSVQLDISMRMIEESLPRCIVVVNALASNIYLARKGITFNKCRGWYEQEMGERRVPVFLSSMLSGQRALDRHSLKRLVWHLGQALGRQVDFDALSTEPRT